MLQYVIPYVPKTAVPINEKLAMHKENGKICFCSSAAVPKNWTMC